MARKCIERQKGAVRTRACAHEITAYLGDKPVGTLEVSGSHGALVVASIDVTGPRRKGIGTALYEAALDLACRTRLTLRSDQMRSPYAESFWQKQTTKGRARCLPGKGDFYMEPSYRRMSPEERASLPARPANDEWGCKQYEITKPCETATLDRSLRGVGRRRR